MELNAGFPWRPTPSIALRMTIWYALSAFTLIFVATGFLYFVLAHSLEQEDTRILTDSLNSVRLLLCSSPGSLSSQPDRALAGALLQEPQVYVRILDEKAQVIVETPNMSAEVPLPTRDELTFTSSGRAIGREMLSNKGSLFQALSAVVRGNAPVRFVQVAMVRDNEERLLRRYRDKVWLVLGLSVLLSSLAGIAIARSGMRPIERIGRTAGQIGSSTLHERIATQGLPSELLRMAETFNSMLDRLEESFGRISQFSNDVAHELRTPINNLRGEIEVALSKGRSSEDYQEILGSCLEECSRISRIVQRLLFLARSDGTTEPLRRENVDIGRELAAVQEFYEPAAAESGISLRLSGTGLVAPLDRILFQQAVGNLVSNALAHTPSGGTIEIDTRLNPSWFQVSVADTGCGISPEHLPHVFDRFYRADRARSGSNQNIGLGLALVKSIAARHGGQVEIDSSVGRGTRVTLIFPRQTTP